MDSFTKTNLQNIKHRFEQETGVELSARSRRRPVRTAVVLVAAVICLAATAAASSSLFSSLSGDDLAFSTTYEGNGIVSIRVENRSDKALRFEEQLKLQRWSTEEPLSPIGPVRFENTEIAPHSEEIMTINLTGAYDLELLEQPLTDDHYYFTLTNNNFLFGQDWMCSVDFAETVYAPIEYPEPAPVDPAAIAAAEESLRFYFKADTTDPADRRAMAEQYIEACTELFDTLGVTVIPSVSPRLPGNRVDTTMSFPTIRPFDNSAMFDETVPVGEQNLLVSSYWTTTDTHGKLLAGQGEYAYELGAYFSDQRLPLLYIFTYEKDAVTDDSYAFLYGQLHTFADLEQYKVYEDGEYICYEISPLIYSDLHSYAEAYAAELGIIPTEQDWQRIENIYNYYTDKETLAEQFYYRITD